MTKNSRYGKVLSEALEVLGYVNIKKVLDSNANKVRLLLRVHNDPEWLKFVRLVLLRQSGWSSHICKVYFLKGVDPKTADLKYGWHVSITSDDMEATLLKIVAIVSSMRSQDGEEHVKLAEMSGGDDNVPKTASYEVPLVGAKEGRGVFDNGKGAKAVR